MVVAVAQNNDQIFKEIETLVANNNLPEAMSKCNQALNKNPNEVRFLNIQGYVALQQKKFDNALDIFQKAIEIEPDNAVLYSNMGLALQGLSREDIALKSFDRALKKNPKLFDAYKNKANLLKQNGKFKKAAKAYKEGLDACGLLDRYEFLLNYSSFLSEAQLFEEAVPVVEKSLSIKPTAEGYHNYGFALFSLGRYQEAAESLSKALSLNPKIAETHLQIGRAYMQMQELEKAIDHLQTSLFLTAPQTKFETWVYLARARKMHGRSREALTAIRLLREHNPKEKIYIVELAEILSKGQNLDLNETLAKDIQTCLTSEYVNPAEMTGICDALLKGQQIFINFMAQKTEKGRLKNFEKFIEENRNIATILSHSVFQAMFSRVTIRSIKIERFIAMMRRHLLDLILDQDNPQERLWPGSLNFIAGLASQAFLTEYVYLEDEKELQQLERLEKELSENWVEGDLTLPYKFAILAAYKAPLKSAAAEKIKKSKSLREVNALKELLQVTVYNPLEEEKIKKDIKTSTPISDEISKLVQDQYEENPYPRWSHIAKKFNHPLDFVISQRHQDKDLFPYPPKDKKLRALVAGCGTGRQSADAASVISNIEHYTAVDLSKSALAYAIRKSREMGYEDIISYSQGDILALDSWDEQFDVVLCGGVLHHMRDPMQGWKIITDRMKKGGFASIALYSEAARRDIVKARDYIAKNGLKPEAKDIKTFREMVLNAKPGDPLRNLIAWNDVFSLSMFRDLVFHVQEHRFTIPQLKDSLKTLGLQFCGFGLPTQVSDLYFKQFPDDPNGLNLDNWHVFEQENPDTFKAMYTFWVYKPGK